MMRERHLYLLGHPVGHSKSAVMYNAVYEAAGLPWRYELLDCPTEADARAVLDGRAFLQVNITTPYKPLAFEIADERTEAVERIGGANVLVNDDGRLVAHNTDGIGCVGFLKREGFAFEGARVAICGTGPTALAILTACAGVVANFILAFLIYPLYLVVAYYVPDIPFITLLLRDFFYFVFAYSLSFFVFNLLPLYPLDGFRILDAADRRNGRVTRFLRSNGQYILFALIAESFLCKLLVRFGISQMAWFDILGWFMQFATELLGWPIKALWGLIPW